MAKLDDVQFQLADMREKLFDDAPVEGPPNDQFQRQVYNSAPVYLLLDLVAELASEVDRLRAQIEASP